MALGDRYRKRMEDRGSRLLETGRPGMKHAHLTLVKKHAGFVSSSNYSNRNAAREKHSPIVIPPPPPPPPPRAIIAPRPLVLAHLPGRLAAFAVSF
ncbi:hypothetical protein NL676_005612 [Syzygium grande]|nr:hypothetical protein NL676_005612 [Syzygium grande]